MIHNYRWRLDLAEGEAHYDDLEKQLAASPVITVPAITLEGDANGAPHLDPGAYQAHAFHVGHSTGGGEVVHYLARHGESRVAKAAIISAVPPLMVQTEANPGGLPKDLKKISVPVLVMHSEDDQVVPYADSGPLSAKLLPNGTLKTYHGFPHGMPTTQAETINADLLAFLKA